MDAPTAVNRILEACRTAARQHQVDRPIFYLTAHGSREVLFASSDPEEVASDTIYNGRTPKVVWLGRLKADGLTIEPVAEVARIDPRTGG